MLKLLMTLLSCTLFQVSYLCACHINSLHVLLVVSSPDTAENEEGNDWLYIVMAHIVNNHNSLIERLYATTRLKGLHALEHLLPSEPPTIPLTEFAPHHCIMEMNL